MSRTLPAAFAEPLDAEPLPVAPLEELLADDVEPFLGVAFLALDDDFFLDAPHVDMTSYTVPTRCHPRP
jgi:hypothetical protein